MLKYTTEKFIELAKDIHKDRYDYSLVKYIDIKTKVIIICHEHGEFYQTPDKHINGKNGCPKCGSNKISVEEFSIISKNLYGNKFDYKIISNENIIVTCPIHGEFIISKYLFMDGQGCINCNKEKIISKKQEEFIAKSNRIHKNKYDYSKVIYINAKKDVIIICPIHGEFSQTPYNHAKGSGCPICSGHKRYTTEIFIEEARIVHNNRYDYSKAVYVKMKQKVIIICPEHGEFEQTPECHLNGCQCRACSNRPFISTESFIIKANKKHNNKYDYSLTKYINMHVNIKIICPEHGEFEQNPWAHLCGSNCPKCAYYTSVSKKSKEYINSLNNINLIKEHRIIIDNKKYVVDAFDPLTNTIYEFNGDFWHGNPILYDGDKINPVTKESFGSLYNKTIEKENILKQAGYNVISVWEYDYDKNK